MTSRRMIDPHLWQSENVAKLTMRQRLLFVGLFSNADDQGRMRAHPLLIRSTIFPFDDISADDIETDLQSIVETGSILIYEQKGTRYLQVINWWKFQRPKWAWPSKIPAPEGWRDRLHYRIGNNPITQNWDENETEEAERADANKTAAVPQSDHNETTVRQERESSETTPSISTRISDSDSLQQDSPSAGAGAPKTSGRASKNTKPQTRTPRIDQAMFAAVGDLCKIDLALLTKKTRGQLNQTGKKLRGANASVVDVEAFGEWWYTIDWRGKKGQPPNTGLVLECWGQFEEWRKDGRPALKPTPSIALQPATTDQTRVKACAQDVPMETRLMQREALKKHKEWKRRKDAGEDVGPAPGAET